MKYWNKRKQVRLKHWTCVKLRIDLFQQSWWIGNYEGWINWTEFLKIKVELQRSSSKNKYYMRIDKKEVWFEHSRDATWFTLKYTEILR